MDCAPGALRSLLLSCPYLHVVKPSHIIKAAEAEGALLKGRVVGGHDGGAHVVEEDLDGAHSGIANNAKVVPGIAPFRAITPLRRNGPSLGGVHDENGVGPLIGNRRDVGVIVVVLPRNVVEDS